MVRVTKRCEHSCEESDSENCHNEDPTDGDMVYSVAHKIKPENGVRQAAKTDHNMAKRLPCLTIEALDMLQLEVSDSESSSDALATYVQSFFGTDVNKAIKKAIDMIIIRDVQKQLSWSGLRTKKVSFERNYKDVVRAMHLALKGKFTDYNYGMLESKVGCSRTHNKVLIFRRKN